MLELLKLWWQKWYLYIALGALVVLGIIFGGFLLNRRKSGGDGSPVPEELDALKKAAEGVRQQIAKADNEAMVKKIRAEAKEQATQRQVDEILKVPDEKEKAKLLIALRKAQKS